MKRQNIILAGLLASCSTFASTGTATSRNALLLIISRANMQPRRDLRFAAHS